MTDSEAIRTDIESLTLVEFEQVKQFAETNTGTDPKPMSSNSQLQGKFRVKKYLNVDSH